MGLYFKNKVIVKKNVVFLICCFVVINLVSCNVKDTLVKYDLNGTIIFNGLLNYKKINDVTEDGRGLSFFDPSTQKHDEIYIEDSSGKISVNRNNSSVYKLNQNYLYEYNIQNKKLQKKVELNLNDNVEKFDPVFLDRYNKICFYSISDIVVNICFYDINTKEIQIVLNDVCGKFSINKEENKILYSDKKGMILEYNIETKESKVLFKEGYNPKYSNSSNGIYAYKRGSYIYVRNLNTGKEYKYNNDITKYNYEFSPNGKYLAITKDKDEFLSEDSELIVWDYENNTEKTLINKLFTGVVDFLWVE